MSPHRGEAPFRVTVTAFPSGRNQIGHHLGDTPDSLAKPVSVSLALGFIRI
jgi:hypothetical protein